MKKTYEKPELQVEPFDVEDVITVSRLEVVGGENETPTFDLGSAVNSPGSD